jgi:type III pantothenate kinase
MLLTIDVGNSTTRFGLFEGEKLKKEWVIETKSLYSWEPSAAISQYPTIISSVVPKADAVLKNKLFRPQFVSAQNIKGIKVKVKNKSEVGADRVVNALAVYKLYGVPAIVIDFGTATTFDVVSKKGEYLGGAIAPGIILTRDVLHERTAKLPKVEIRAPKNIIGDSTVEALRSGLLYGYVAMVEGMLLRFKAKIGGKAKVVATGGLAKLIGKYAKGIDIIDEKLTLKGLKLAWQKN